MNIVTIHLEKFIDIRSLKEGDYVTILRTVYESASSSAKRRVGKRYRIHELNNCSESICENCSNNYTDIILIEEDGERSFVTCSYVLGDKNGKEFVKPYVNLFAPAH